VKCREFITLLGGAGMAVCGAGATPYAGTRAARLAISDPPGRSDGETLRGIRQALRMSGSSTAAPWSSRCAMRKASPSACEDLSRICLGWTSRKQRSPPHSRTIRCTHVNTCHLSAPLGPGSIIIFRDFRPLFGG
jgi:hypothetical protein